MRRRKTAVLLVLTALLAAGFLLWGNCSLQTTETALVSPALPPAFDGLRIVELADLHGRVFGRGSRRLLAAVRRAEPDLICIDGDLFDEHTDLAMLPPLLRGLCAIAPVYYVTGNHEWRVPGLRGILAQMRACGVTVLQDDWRVLRRGDDALIVAGTDDPCGPAESCGCRSWAGCSARTGGWSPHGMPGFTGRAKRSCMSAAGLAIQTCTFACSTGRRSR